MHKDEASKLFRVLGNEDRVKIIKILYNNNEVSLENFYHIFSCDHKELEMHFSLLKDANLITVRSDNQNTYFSCNKELLDELMSFFKTKCSCCNQVNGD